MTQEQYQEKMDEKIRGVYGNIRITDEIREQFDRNYSKFHSSYGGAIEAKNTKSEVKFNK